MRLRIGELLVRRGVLTPEQCEQILERQRVRHRPFGVLAEELFEVPPAVLQEVWAEQFEAEAPRVNPLSERVCDRAKGVLNRRQAWQFQMMPLRFEGDELLMCTTRAHLPRSLNFAYRHLGPVCAFALSEPSQLQKALEQHYPWRGPIDPHTASPLSASFGAAALLASEEQSPRESAGWEGRAEN